MTLLGTSELRCNKPSAILKTDVLFNASNALAANELFDQLRLAMQCFEYLTSPLRGINFLSSKFSHQCQGIYLEMRTEMYH